MHPLKARYYQSRYIATVRFKDGNNFVIEGGKEGKKPYRLLNRKPNSVMLKMLSQRVK